MIRLIVGCRRWTLAVLLLDVCLMISCGGDGGTKPADSVPVCQITPSALAFDTVAVDQTKDLTFTIKNTGTGTLTGTVIENCSAYSIPSGDGSYSLTAGQEKAVTVRFAPTVAGVQSCAVSLGATACGSVGCSGTGTEQPAGMVLVSAGTFTMGSPTTEPGRFDNET